jgi:hypothetical protein
MGHGGCRGGFEWLGLRGLASGLRPTHRDRAAMDGARGLSWWVEWLGLRGLASGLRPTHRDRAAMDGAHENRGGASRIVPLGDAFEGWMP